MSGGLRLSRYCDACWMVQCSCYLAQNTSISPQLTCASQATICFKCDSSIFSSLSSSGLQRARRLGPPLAHRAPSTSPRGGGGSNRDVSPPACPGQPPGLLLGWSPPVNLCLKRVQRQVHTRGGGILTRCLNHLRSPSCYPQCKHSFKTPVMLLCRVHFLILLTRC